MNDQMDSYLDSRQKPFRPSWIDYLVTWIERLPGPSWAFYLIVLLICAILNNVVIWIVGADDIGSIHLLFTFAAIFVVYGVGFYHYLSKVANTSLHDIYPLLGEKRNNEQDLKFRLTHLPANWGWIALLVGSASGVFDALSSQEQMEFNSKLIFTYSGIFAAFSYSAIFALIFRTAFQLRIVVSLHHQVADIDLFNLNPLRAFSKLTAVAGFSIFLLGAISALIYMEDSDPSLLVFYFSNVIIGILIFTIPLMSIRSRIRKEKKQKLLDNDQRIKNTLEEIKQSLHAGNMEKMSDFNTTLAVLEKEKSILRSISSFPWNPGTLKSLISSILIPILLWWIRTILEKWI